MLTLLGTVFGSIFSGGATGLIGVAIQRYADYKNKQIDVQAALELKKLDMTMQQAEIAGRVTVANVQAEAAQDVAASQAFAASMAMEPKRYSEGVQTGKVGSFLLVLLDVFRGIVRPALTLYLCALTTYIWVQAHDVLGKHNLSDEQAIQIWMLIVETILYLMTTCVLWYYGTRNKQPMPTIK
jgi:hypothetical protein